MASSFQEKLRALPPLEAGYCHNLKEVIEAVEYLEDDLAQGLRLSSEVNAGSKQHGDNVASLDKMVEGLRQVKDEAARNLRANGCPEYGES